MTTSVLLRSKAFEPEVIQLAGTEEVVVRGGRHLFPRLPRAFAGIRRIGVVGWGPQGSAQARNLRDSLAGTGIEVCVGLRRGSPSWGDAEAAGFTEASGTLGEVFDIVAASDLVVLLVNDAAQVALADRLFPALRPGATLGLSHGFLLASLTDARRDVPPHVNVVAVCPKGMGASVRRLYEQGREVAGAGINASVAVHRDLDGAASDIALGWAVALGAPFIFETTLEQEYLSDLVGERAALLGGLHGLVEALYGRLVEHGCPPDIAFVHACETITGPLARTVSTAGFRGVEAQLRPRDLPLFEAAYCAGYRASRPLVAEIYDEVSSGDELRRVILANARLARHPMTPVDGSGMWRVGSDVRAARATLDVPLDPTAAGLYCGLLVAQVDELRERGHRWSEIANESVIEAVDSLIPYMHSRGVAHMIDNCSTTARLGARTWGPRFESQFRQVALPALDGPDARDDGLLASFRTHPIHEVLDTIAAYRPAVDIAVDCDAFLAAS